jgi:hypothetical protein
MMVSRPLKVKYNTGKQISADKNAEEMLLRITGLGR